ncbi:hypothetical protein BB561_006710 [Smittium simulii]|uniref:Uncharacterized protein n=1 Tax=Smittium simulii TaxID=133385 RepID=A0A2T9Y254_9FUNG|nr:hypothetical protein BB561_006710 [Smittium simulii]
MVYIRLDVYTVKQDVQRLQCRYICVYKTQKNNLLQLVPRSQDCRAQCLNTQLEILGKSTLLPTMEPDNTNNQKGTPRENNSNNNNLVLKDWNMVPISTRIVCSVATVFKSNHSNSGPKKRNKLSKNLTSPISAAQIVTYLAENTLQINLRPNSELTIKNLTSKLSWLLAVTGLLKPSNIHRIDNLRTHLTNSILHLDTPIPKSLAELSTLTVRSGASVDDIVNHAL